MPEYRFLDCCANCLSKAWVPYGISLGPGAMHFAQSRCRDCGLVFANPQASSQQLSRFYSDYYSGIALQKESESHAAHERERRKRNLDEISRLKSGGAFLEIGTGTGETLKLAQKMGFEVSGVEISPKAAKAANELLGSEAVLCGSFEDAELADARHDVVLAWHVIEHVPNLGCFLEKVHRILKDGGIFYFGTESYAHWGISLQRVVRWMTGRLPRAVTATEHAYVFSPHSLQDCLERRGFQVPLIKGYDELPLSDRIRFRKSGSTLKNLNRVFLEIFSSAFNYLYRTGPYLRGAAVKGPTHSLGMDSDASLRMHVGNL